MPAILKLANETLLQIVDNVHPDDIVNLSRSCRILNRLARDTLAQHVIRRKTYNKVTLYGCHRHQDDTHPITLIAEICKDPRIAYYPRSLNIECCERFAISGGDEAYNNGDESDSEEEEKDKKGEIAMAQHIVDTSESSIVNLMGARMTNFPLYFPPQTGSIESVLEGMREDVRGYMLGLLLVLLPNLEDISLTQYSTGADAFLQAIHKVALSYSDNSEPGCRALTKLSKVYLRSPREEEEHDEPCVSMDFDLFRNFAALPSVKSFVGISIVNMGMFEWASDLCVPALTSFELQDSDFDGRDGLNTLLSRMPKLTSFTYGSGSQFCVQDEDLLASHELDMAVQPLLHYLSKSLETLNISGGFAIGQPMFTADGESSLRGFQSLKEARLHLALLVKDEDLYYEEHSDCTCDLEDAMGRWKHDIPRLVNILPPSLESIVIYGTVTVADLGSLLSGFADHAAENVPKLKKIVFLQAESDRAAPQIHLVAIRIPQIYLETTITLSTTRDSSDGSTVSDKISFCARAKSCDDEPPYTERESPATAISTNNPLPPPSFSSLYFPPVSSTDRVEASITEPDFSPPPAFCPAPPINPTSTPASTSVEAETKATLPSDTKSQSPGKGLEDGEPPPPYTEGSSPLDSFTYVMAAAGGPASLITQVQQGGGVGRPGSTLADVSPDEHITLDLRGTRFTLSRDELLTLPEFVLLSLFPNGLLPDGHTNSFHEDVYPVDYDPASLQYMLEFFRNVAQTIPSSSPSPAASPVDTPITSSAPGDSARDMLQDRAGIIVLREDLDFYAIPPKADIDQPEMIEVKRAAGRALLGQDGIFSGLRRSEETGTTEQHLIEMLTAGGFHNDDRWGHRAGEPNKAVICSLALARLRTDIKGNELANSNAVGMAQKLLLFWRKPARRCWWEGVELDGVDGVEGKLKVWIRRVWTLEMSVIGLR